MQEREISRLFYETLELELNGVQSWAGDDSAGPEEEAVGWCE